MKDLLFAIYDSKIPVYEELHVMRSNGEAIRTFEYTCRQKGNKMNEFPKDYSLFLIGEWDRSNGQLVKYDAPIHISNATEFINGSMDNAPLSAVK